MSSFYPFFNLRKLLYLIDSNDDKIMKDGLKFVVDNDYKM